MKLRLRGVRLLLLVHAAAARMAVPASQRFRTSPTAVVPDAFPVFIKLKKCGSATVKQALFSRMCGSGGMRWRASCGEFQGETTPELYGRGGVAALSNCFTPRRRVRVFALVTT